MHESLLLVSIVVATTLGFACLAVSIPRNWERVTGERMPPVGAVKVLRVAGYAALGAGLALAILYDGPSFGSVLWTMVLAIAAAAVALALTWRAGWFRLLARTGRSTPAA